MNRLNNGDRKKKDDEPESKRLHSDGTKGNNYHEMSQRLIKSRNAIYYILGIIEIILAFRFILKILGANSQNVFVSFLYSIAGFFSAPFSGIFSSFVPYGFNASSVFEPAVIIGMVVYAVIAWGLVGLISMSS